jgi:penicillin-binding protein 2
MSTNGKERGNLVESHKGYDPRVIVFYPFIAVLLLILAGGMAYQQLWLAERFHESERKQNQRRILVPGPRIRG